MSFSNQLPILISTLEVEDVFPFIPFEAPQNHPDVVWINQEHEGITIDIVRSLKEQVLSKPYQADISIYVLLHLHESTMEAQQALLKLLEEPPAHVRFILTVNYPSVLLSTILSRVHLHSESKKGEPETTHRSFHELKAESVGARVQWVTEIKDRHEALLVVTAWMEEITRSIETQPTLTQVNQLRNLSKGITYLQANTNPKLVLEHLLLV
jgi:hypothetical protein